MAESREPPTGDNAVYVFVAVFGGAFVAQGVRLLAEGSSVPFAVGFLAVGALILLTGLRWSWVKQRFGERFTGTARMVAADARWWTALLMLLFVYVATPGLLKSIAAYRSVGTPVAGSIPDPNVAVRVTAIRGVSALGEFAFEFLKLQRPCYFKIVAPIESIEARTQLSESMARSLLPGLPSGGGSRIGPCEVVDEERDGKPDRYVAAREYPASGAIVSAPEGFSREATFVADLLRNTGLDPVLISPEMPSLGSGTYSPQVRARLILIEFGHNLWPK